MIRVVIPHHLRTLAGVKGELHLEIESPVTQNSILDVVETTYPMLRGTIRDHVSRERRAFIRFFVCGEDWSHQSPNAPLPDAIVTGKEPFRIIGAMAGG
jgi:hypothetical protein